jgi:RNA polymerase sigma factor (sigma-70 family)
MRVTTKAAIPFDQVFVDHYPAIHRFVARRIGSEESDDVAADVFITALANWGRFDTSRPIRPWLFGIAANLLRRRKRDEVRRLRAYASFAGSDVTSVQDDLGSRPDAETRCRAMAGALSRLRAVDREALLMSAWGELTDEEIALALSIPVGTVKSRISRAKARLRGLDGSHTSESRVARSEEGVTP